MAKPLSHIIAFKPRTQIIEFPTKQCGCHRPSCGLINTIEHAYIYSKATGEYYSDMECMSRGLGVLYEPYERSVFFDGEWMKIGSFMKELQAEWMNDLTPIA